MAYEAVAQRAQLFARDTGDPSAAVRVVIDRMDGATPKGRRYHENLKRHHAQLKKTGSQLLRGFRLPCLEDLAFVDSKDSQLIQAADLIAYNVFRQFRDHGEAWEDESLRQLPLYDWFRRLLGKFRQSGNGRIQGFGVVKLPLLRRVRWRVVEREG